jgi:hypothetical protein
MKRALQHFAEHRQNHPTLTSHVDENRIERAVFERHPWYRVVLAWQELHKLGEKPMQSLRVKAPKLHPNGHADAEVSTRPERLRWKGAIICAVLDHAWIMGWRGTYRI